MGCKCRAMSTDELRLDINATDIEEDSALCHLLTAREIMHQEYAEVASEPDYERLYRDCILTLDATIKKIKQRLYNEWQ